jgi:predicted GIY-YIG superfamily endonuclease
MVYVYILRSVRFPEQRYVGVTGDLRRRLREHDEGKCSSTARFAPWVLETYIAFLEKQKALAFEKFLKSGSGTAFRHRRL